ncbi:MAG: methionyl-tRNA formyltransferase [Epulopiscium sp.]|jgi:methionyl-tRNA formyltransferase|uniref:Methionyl-tRNA formyltransferase n=1 Tax=Defluviitalea raffinosedens TaxID=1450156 RepID=A0A7C8LUV1_9FIRM|nr:methionyl-tRNA formyltransferase [Defluviitalea raffinosedens]KAE9637206.1 methionyl-tRNA formyltransferase [Defluviitalea raffinosedens]MDK2788663.1 methionyl-tRNA formyltransferase [Candidatus Epulonipiscium sp.]HHW66766.1 methionyl-tRNA formyltransferase [Candidatus Epulonipiscium sp.]
MKVVFMGTPDFAVPCLQKLIDEKYYIAAVVTQPDRPKGRGKKMVAPPVKELAEKYNIPVFQPEKVRNPEFIEVLRSIAPDLIVVIAFGQILPKEILDIPTYGCINVHGSLLPKYRGAAPIQWAIINGEKITGVTTMFMDEGMDTGDMILKKEIFIEPEYTAGDLHNIMAPVGAELLKETLDELIRGNIKREKQDENEATYAPMLKKENGLIDWSQPSYKIVNLIRGLSPWPSAYTFYKDQMIKIWKAEVYDKIYEFNAIGEIVEVIKNKGLIVKTGDSSLLITEIQAPNGKRMTVEEYLRGHDIEQNIILGSHF